MKKIMGLQTTVFLILVRNSAIFLQILKLLSNFVKYLSKSNLTIFSKTFTLSRRGGELHVPALFLNACCLELFEDSFKLVNSAFIDKTFTFFFTKCKASY